jgi:hypothetical protein
MSQYIREIYEETLLTQEVRVELFVAVFRIRDIKCGYGRRREFYEMMETLYEMEPECIERVLHFVPVYGCYRDLFELMVRIPELEDTVLSICKRAYISDYLACKRGDLSNLSKVAKWLPREKSKTWPGLAKKFAVFLYPMENSTRLSMIQYRKGISFINRHLGTAEVHMCAGTWEEIDFEKIPKKCFTKYKAALLNETLEGLPRYPDVLDREICAENTLNYIRPVHIASVLTDDSRYYPIADAIRLRT